MSNFASMVFETVGDKFFFLLYSKNKVLYLQCLHDIYSLSNERLNRFLDQSEVVQCVIHAINEYKSAIYDEDSGQEITDIPRQKASLVISYMIRYGWLRKEQRDNSFDFNIFLSDNGVKLIRNARTYLMPSLREYTGYLQRMYNTLSTSKGSVHSYTLMHREVFEDALLLKESMQDLSTYIKDMVKSITRTTTYQALFENVDDMANGRFLPQWTRLIESENRYIRAIEGEINSIIDNPDYFNAIVDDYMKEKKERNRADAEGKILSELNDILDFMSPAGGLFVRIVADIRERIHTYVIAVWNRMQILELKGSKDLREIAERFLRIPPMPEWSYKDLFCLDNNSQLTLRSLKQRPSPRKKREQKPETVKRLTDAERADAINKVRKQYDDPSSPENIKALLERLIDGKVEIKTEDFDLSTKERFITAMQAIGSAPGLGYDIALNEGHYETDKFAVRELTIKKGECEYDD